MDRGPDPKRRRHRDRDSGRGHVRGVGDHGHGRNRHTDRGRPRESRDDELQYEAHRGVGSSGARGRDSDELRRWGDSGRHSRDRDAHQHIRADRPGRGPSEDPRGRSSTRDAAERITCAHRDTKKMHADTGTSLPVRPEKGAEVSATSSSAETGVIGDDPDAERAAFRHASAQSDTPAGTPSAKPGSEAGAESPEAGEVVEGDEPAPGTEQGVDARAANVSAPEHAGNTGTPASDNGFEPTAPDFDAAEPAAPDLSRPKKRKPAWGTPSDDGYTSSNSTGAGDEGRHGGLGSEGEPLHDSDGTMSGSDIDTMEMDKERVTREEMEELLKEYGWLVSCRNIEDHFEKLNTIDEGTYGVVFRAKDKDTGEICALKKIKLHAQMVQREGFPMTSLREINLLLQLRHPNVVRVKEVVMDHRDRQLNSVFMVMEYTDHDMKSVMEAMKLPFSQSEVKCIMVQLLKGIDYMHRNWIIHRDIKANNLLLDHNGVMKLCDFGLARKYGSPLRPYTPYDKVVTLWYRAPELLLGTEVYSTAVDMWSCGCIFAELLNKEPLFPAKSELEAFERIMAFIGPPQETDWPDLPSMPNPYKVKFALPQRGKYKSLEQIFPSKMGFDPSKTYLTKKGRDLLTRMLTYDPRRRITAEEALNHPYFQETPLPADPDKLPKIESTHEISRAKRGVKSPEDKDRLLRMLEDDEARYKRAARERHYPAHH